MHHAAYKKREEHVLFLPNQLGDFDVLLGQSDDRKKDVGIYYWHDSRPT
jgi:hypothetical protein